MPNFMPWSSDAVGASRPAAQDLLEGRAALAALEVLELGESRARLLERRGDERPVLALLGLLQLTLDVAQVEPLLRHHALERLDVLGAIEAAEMGLELVVGQPLDDVDGREGDDAPDVLRELRHHLAVAAELLRAVREISLDLGRHGVGLDAEAVDPVGEHPRVPLLVTMVDLHRAMQLPHRLHLAEEALEADDSGVLADAVLLEDECVRLGMANDLAEAGQVEVDGVVE